MDVYFTTLKYKIELMKAIGGSNSKDNILKSHSENNRVSGSTNISVYYKCYYKQ